MKDEANLQMQCHFILKCNSKLTFVFFFSFLPYHENLKDEESIQLKSSTDVKAKDQTKDEKEPLLQTTNESERNSNLPSGSAKHEGEDGNVTDEVKGKIQEKGIDFLLEMSPEHDKYHSGIAQLLKIPVELLKMEKEQIKTFVRNYKEGHTKLYCGRVMVVGCFGAGKTTLVKKLKGEDVSISLDSTRGLEVHTNIFIVEEDKDEDETGLTVNEDEGSGQRLNIYLKSGFDRPSSIAELSNPEIQPLTETHPEESKGGLEVQTNISSENEDKIGLRVNKDQNSGQKMHLESLGSKVAKTSLNSDCTNPNSDAEISATTVPGAINDVQHTAEKHKHELDSPSQKMATANLQHVTLPNVSEKPLKTISLLDFAGQRAYYACHHIFLSPRTVYMLVTDMSKKLTEKPTNAVQTEDEQAKDLMYSSWTYHDYIKHWLGSIHTYSSKTAPVIFIQSHSEGKEKKEEEKFYLEVKEGVTEILQNHLSSERKFAVEKISDKNIKEIKRCMLKVITKQRHWGESIPASWVHLETYLWKIKTQHRILKQNDLWETLSSQRTFGITSKDDMITALTLFNDIGVILFNTSTESIVLDVQWFVNAFKHIITDEDHAIHDIEQTKTFKEWRKFSNNGILPKSLVKAIWKGSDIFTEHTEDLLTHMIRLGMIAVMEEGEKYYVPCMNKQEYDKGVLLDCTCSSTVCFMFEYLPLVIFHRLIATCMTKEGWRIWDGNNPTATAKTEHCVFHTAAILHGKGNLKILIGITENKHTFDKNYPYSIEIQRFVFGGQNIREQLAGNTLKTIEKHLRDLSSCFGANSDMAYKTGYRCSIVPFSDQPYFHIIPEDKKECKSCRKAVDVDYLKSFWKADNTSQTETSDNEEKTVVRKATEHTDNISKDKDLAESDSGSDDRKGDEEKKTDKESGDTELAQTGEDGMKGQMERPFRDEARFTADIHTGYDYLHSVSCVSEERVWTCGFNNTMKLLTVQGQLLSSVQTKSGNDPRDITVTREGDLVYTDPRDRSINLVKDNKIRTLITLQGWRPLHVCCTTSGDLLVTMISNDYTQSKVVRYSGSTETQTIQYDVQGRPLYSSDDLYKYISENRNLDICVADRSANAVVVVNQSGALRFRYTGHPSNTGPSFDPMGIATDSQGHILIADFGINGRIHILDQDGQFLRYIHNLQRPWGLCVDSRDNLFVAECHTAKVKIIQYLESQC